MASAGSAYVDIRGDLSSLNKQLGAFFGGSKFGGLGKKAGLAVGVGLGAGLAAGAGGKALFDLGATFDEQFDKIRVATGKTGKSLDGLEGDFKNVLKGVPANFGDVGTAVAGLSSRLGLTGKPLQKLARQMVQLSRITKTDVGENVESLTRLFGDWSISTARQSGTLDKLFRIQQRTGLSVSKNARLLVQFGAPLRQLGFDFDEAAVMFGKFEKEGVNLQTILPGFRFGLKNLSKPTGEAAEALDKLGISAKDPKVALQQLFAAIKKAPSDLEATGIASAVFGRRAGSDMAAAVREGRFEYDGLIKSIKGGGDTIDKAEKNTRDFAEQWDLLKNRIFVGLEPLANKVFDTIGDGMEKLATADFGEIGADLQLDQIDLSGLEESAGNIRSIVRSLQPVFTFIGDVAKRQLGGIAQVFQGAAQTIKGATQLISGILTLDFRKSWEGVKNIFGGGVKTSLGLLRTMTAPVREIAARAGSGIASAFRSAWRSVRSVFSDGIGAALRALRGMVGAAGDLGERIGRAIVGGIRKALRTISSVVGNIFRGGGGLVANIGDSIRDWLNDNTPFGDKIDLGVTSIRIPKLAKGGIASGLALVGEEGPELAKFAGKTTLIGQDGPEVLSLPVGTRVYSHPETKRKLAPLVQEVSRVLDGKSLPGVEAAKQSLGQLSSGPLGGRAIARIAEKLGIPGFAKGGIVRRDSKTVERELRDRLGTERFERLDVKRLIEKAGPERTERFVDRLGPERFSRLVESQGLDRVSREVERTTTSREVGGLTERVQSLVKDTVSKVLPPVAIGGERGPAGFAGLAPIAAPSPQVIKTGDKYVAVAQRAGEPVALSVASSPIQVSAGAAPPQVLDLTDVRDRKVREVVERAAAVGADSNAPGRRIARKSQLAGVSVTPAEVSGITQKWGVNRAVASIGAAVKDKFPAMSVMSGFRSGATTKSGNRSNHAIRAALDLGARGSLNRRIGSWVRSNFPSSLRGVSEGVLDIDNDPNPPDHADHVHVAALGSKALANVMEAGADGTGADKKTRRITGGTLSLGQMVTLAKTVKFPDPALAAAVGYAESRGKVGAVGDGGDSLGPWQINTPAHPKYDEKRLSHDAFYNARAALAISKQGKDWTPWTQFRTGAYKQFLGASGKALPNGKGTATGQKKADFLALEQEEALGTLTLRDDIRAINRGLRYYRGVYRRNKGAGNAARAKDALSTVHQLQADKKALREKDAQTFENLGSLAPKIGTGPNAFKTAPLERVIEGISLEKARAALTIPADTDDTQTGLAASLQDDIAAATRLVGIWDGLYKLTTGIEWPPGSGKQIIGTIKQQIDAATNLKSARDEVKSLQDETGKTDTSEVPAENTQLVELLRQQLEESRKELAISKAQFPVFERFKKAPRFHEGGVIQGPAGSDQPAILKAKEGVFTPEQMAAMGQPQPQAVLVVVEDGAVDSSKIRAVAWDAMTEREREMIRKARSGPSIGRKYAFNR